MTVLYNCRHDGDQYRITKFNDGEVESSYLTTHDLCDCPAGHRHSCRHRQMLSSMLLHGIVDTHWFLDWDGAGYPVDLMGTPKSTIDALIAPIKEDMSMTAACPPGCCAPAEQDTETYGTAPFITSGGLEMLKAENEDFQQRNAAAEPPHKALVRTSLPPAFRRRL